MADGFVDLQHHLVRHQQQVPRALGGIGRQQQLQGLVGDPRRSPQQATAADHIAGALLAEVLPAEAAGLAVAAVVGGHVQARVDETLGLAQLGAGAVEVDLLDLGHADAHLPVHQAFILGHRGRLIAQQLIAVAEGGEGLLQVGREIVRAVAGDRLLTQVQQGMGGDDPGLLLGAVQGGLQAALRQVVGGGVGFHAAHPHGQHRPFVSAQARRLGDVLAHRQVLVRFADITQGKEFGARAQGSEALLELGVKVEHGGPPCEAR